MSKPKTKPQYPNPYKNALIFAVPFFILTAVLIISRLAKGGQQFSELAQAFIHGHLNFLKPIGGVGQDPILYHGKIYWGEGLFPAVLLMPLVGLFDLFHKFFFQSYLQWILSLGVIYLIYRLARIHSYSKEDSLILMLGFVLGSVFIGVMTVPSSWFFAQVLTTLLLLWSLYEFYTRKRWWLLGIICGLILLTRATAAPILIFYALELWFNKAERPSWFNKSVALLVPVFIAIALTGAYNFLRFHNPLNGGYKYQLLYPNSAVSRSLGIFSLIHIPTNLYAAILRAPLPVFRTATSWTLKFPYIQNNIYGMSIFITSPYLLYIFTRKWKSFDSQARHLIIAISVSCLLVFCFYGGGMLQYGYRYSLDFMPELFLLFMIMYRKSNHSLSTGMKSLLIGSGILNFYLLISFIVINSYII